MRFRFQTLLLNLMFYTLFILVVVVWVPVVALTGFALAPFFSHRRNMQRLRIRIRSYGRIMLYIGWPFIRARVEMEAGNPPDSCIYVCNHRATSDGFLMGMLECEGVQVVNLWPFKVPVLGYFARMAGYLNIRELPIEEFMSQCTKLLSQGVSIIAFPEGTRAGSRTMGPFHSALFRLALQTGTPIVPICISGSEDKPNKGSVIMHPGQIRLRLLTPIPPETYAGMSSFKLKNHVHDLIAAELKKMEPVE